MFKKLIMACMAIAAFGAFVIAPSASATTLTESGSVIPVGSSVESRNVEVVEFKSSIGVVACSVVTLKGKVTQNNTTGPVKLEIPVGSATYSGTGTNGDCTSSNFGLPSSAAVDVKSKLCLEAGANDKLTVTGCAANITFTLTFTGSPTCNYEAAKLEGTYTTNTTPAVATIPGGPNGTAGGNAGNPFGCPANVELFQKFNLTTTGGGTGLTVS